MGPRPGTAGLLSIRGQLSGAASANTNVQVLQPAQCQQFSGVVCCFSDLPIEDYLAFCLLGDSLVSACILLKKYSNDRCIQPYQAFDMDARDGSGIVRFLDKL